MSETDFLKSMRVMTATVLEEVRYLHCSACGKQVSSGFVPIPTDTPDKGLIVRAWIECPECIEKRTP